MYTIEYQKKKQTIKIEKENFEDACREARTLGTKNKNRYLVKKGEKELYRTR